MGTQLDLFPETLEVLCGQAPARPQAAVQASAPEADVPVSDASGSDAPRQSDAVASPAAAFAAMGKPSDQRYLPLHLLHSGTRTYH
jgi:hypothetical protein